FICRFDLIQRFVVCGMSLAFPLIFLFLLFKPIVTTLRSFSEHTVLTFIENAAKTNISEKCAKSLQMVGPFLSAYDTIVDQKEFLISSYSVGMTNAVDGRDQFRWAHMMSRCQAVAAERSYSISENPTEYCVGRSANKDDPNTYGVCLPQPCHNDRYRLLEEWISLVRNSSHTKEAETVICQRSRKEKEWYEMWPPLLDFCITFTFILIIGLATAYDMARGGAMAECGQSSTIKQIFLA
uniref:Acyltransferase 3 domain-containing protein n=1 Tax=Parascaris univalens TaxID=6257 RepID=A0A914ZQF7_PARUN